MADDSVFNDEDIIDYRYYLELLRTVLLKHLRLIIFFCVACVTAAILYVQSQAPIYASTLTLHVAPKESFFTFDSYYWTDEEKFQETQIGLLESRKLKLKVVDEIDLHKAGKLTPSPFDAGIARVAREFLASFREPDPVKEISEEEQIEKTAAVLSNLMTISKPPNREYSNLLNVTVQMADPDLATLTANTIGTVYIDLVFENEIESARKNQQFLSDRLAILRDDLRNAEQRLQAYREQQDIVAGPSGSSEVDDELASLSNRYFESRENRLRQENLYKQVQNISPGSRAWEKLPAISNHPSITRLQSDLRQLTQRKSELSKRYGSRHNKMIAVNSEISAIEDSLRSRVQDIVAGIRSEYELSVKIEEAAEETLSSVRGRKQELGRKEYQLNELTQDVEAKREVYSMFLNRLNQDGAAGPVRNDNLWIADPAAPGKGSRTSMVRAGIIALILSLGFALGIGLLLELTRNTINTTDDVEKKLSVPLIGFLPLINDGVSPPSGLAYEEYLNNPNSRFSEALRTVRTSITLSGVRGERANRFLVTSSQMGEGKTSVSLSLAASFGQMSKVIVLDGDLRKPSVERVLNTSNHQLPGLTDVIAGSHHLVEAIQTVEPAGIDVLYAGSRTIKPLELLQSLQFRELVDELSETYDTIIIDSPPCVSVSDAYVLSTLVDSVIFVVKSNEAKVQTIRHSLQRFSSIDANLAGVLLNQLDMDAAHNYGRYQDYYDYKGYGGDTIDPPLKVVS